MAADTSARGEAYFFIAKLHALTSLRDADRLRRLTFDVALDYLALGFDRRTRTCSRRATCPR